MTSPTSNPRISGEGDPDGGIQFVFVNDEDDSQIPANDGTGFTQAEAYAYLAGDMSLAYTAEPGPTGVPETPVLTAAADQNGDEVEEQTGAMIALVPSDNDLQRLVLVDNDAEPDTELHLTIIYLGKAADFSLMQRAGIISRLQEVTLTWGTIQATGFGAAVWNPEGDDPALVLNVGGCDCLEETRDAICEELESMMIEYAEQHQPYVPHVCLAYGDPDTLVDQMGEALTKVGPIVFDKVRIAFGTEVVDLPLVYSETDDTLME